MTPLTGFLVIIEWDDPESINSLVSKSFDNLLDLKFSFFSAESEDNLNIHSSTFGIGNIENKLFLESLCIRLNNDSNIIDSSLLETSIEGDRFKFTD